MLVGVERQKESRAVLESKEHDKMVLTTRVSMRCHLEEVGTEQTRLF